MNLWRSWLTQSRDLLSVGVGVGMNAILGLVYGVLYFNQIPVRACDYIWGSIYALVSPRSFIPAAFFCSTLLNLSRCALICFQPNPRAFGFG